MEPLPSGRAGQRPGVTVRLTKALGDTYWNFDAERRLIGTGYAPRRFPDDWEDDAEQ